MENASKALLIAAAVLVVILLIAFGMSVMSNTEDVQDAGSDVSSALSEKTGTAADEAYQAITGTARPTN